MLSQLNMSTLSLSPTRPSRATTRSNGSSRHRALPHDAGDAVVLACSDDLDRTLAAALSWHAYHALRLGVAAVEGYDSSATQLASLLMQALQ
jgi:hypothetical protein